MRLPLYSTLLLSLFATAPASQTPSSPTSAAPLRLVSTPWPPFTNEPGQPRFALDLVEAALGRIGMTSKTTIVEPARFTPALLSNVYDGSAAAWKDSERERALLFSQPYLENRLILVGRKDEDVSATALSDLKGKRIAIVEGYAYGDALDKSGAILVRARGEEESLTFVLQNKADYVLMDDLVVQYIVNNYADEAKAKLNIGATPLVRRPLFFAVRRARPDAASIISQFNAQLRGMIADRTYHKLLHVPWISADIDGDGRPEFIPESDRAGKAPPRQAYTLFLDDQALSTPKPTQNNSRFFVGGSIYADWASVPDRFKVEDPRRPDFRRSTASIFTFTW
jgi:polar amino acid transport system substrate-binding protein